VFTEVYGDANSRRTRNEAVISQLVTAADDDRFLGNPTMIELKPLLAYHQEIQQAIEDLPPDHRNDTDAMRRELRGEMFAYAEEYVSDRPQARSLWRTILKSYYNTAEDDYRYSTGDLELIPNG
jgi:hypothetical protein